MARSSLAARMHGAVTIHRLILSGNYPNASEMAKTLKTTRKTVRAYIRLLGDTFGLFPVYDPSQYGYAYPEGSRAHLVPRLKEQDVVAIFLFEQMTRSFKDTPVEPVLCSILDKLTMALPAECGLSMDQVVSALSLRLERAESLQTDPAILTTIYHAMTARQRLSITYKGLQRKAATKRMIDPLHLTRCEGQWYLVAWCHLRQDIRVFVPARMLAAEPRKEKIGMTGDFDAEAFFRSAFGIVAGYDVSGVSLRFDATVAPIIRERRWHATQGLEELPNGGVRLRMTCSQGPELQAWLLGWGRHVIIEAPKQLAKTIRDEHREAAGQTIRE